MRDWLLVLLDPTDMAVGTHDPSRNIKTPPYFEIPSAEEPVEPEHPTLQTEDPVEESANGTASPPPTAEPKVSRKRSLRSASPSKALPPTTPGRKIATPRRTKRGRPTASLLAPFAEEEDASASVEPEPTMNGDTIKVDIEKTVTDNANGEEETTTHVTVETPANHPQLSLPDDAQAYLEQANRALVEANKLTASRATGRKRKARDMEIEDAQISALMGGESSSSGAAGRTDSLLTADDDALEIRPAKRIRATELELKKEKVKRRALTGVAASLAFGYVFFPFLTFIF